MRDNIGLNARQSAFVKLCAANPDLSTVECFVRAGYAGRDSANASALKKRLHEFIEEERAKLGYTSEEAPSVDDEEVAALLKQARETHRLAIESSDLKSAAKALRVIERALKPRRPPGRPVTAKPAAPAPSANNFAHLSAADIVNMVLSAEEIGEIDAKYAAVDEGRAAWLRGETQSLDYLRHLAIEQQLETWIIGCEEPKPVDLKSSASVIAPEAGEVVRRL